MSYYKNGGKANVDRNKRQLQARNREYLDKAKEGPCVDCGVQYPPYVMDFDHVRGEKKDKVSNVARSASIERLQAEIDKCDLVCANCHRERTHNRLPVGY